MTAPQLRSNGGRWLNALLAVALVVAVGGVAFAFGRLSAPAAASANGANGRIGGFGPRASGGPFPSGGFNRGAGGFADVTVRGTVESVTPTTLAVRLASGTTVELSLDGSTTYHRQASAAATDIQPGGSVIVELRAGGFGAVAGPEASGSTARRGTASSVTIAP